MIFFETAHQARVFLLLLLAGMASGLLYDVFSLVRKRITGVFAALQDILYVFLVGAMCFAALFTGGEKELRLYAILGIFCGAGVYSLGVRRIFRWLFQKCFRPWRTEKRHGRE